jgi:hypothetical protein
MTTCYGNGIKSQTTTNAGVTTTTFFKADGSICYSVDVMTTAAPFMRTFRDASGTMVAVGVSSDGMMYGFYCPAGGAGGATNVACLTAGQNGTATACAAGTCM